MSFKLPLELNGKILSFLGVKEIYLLAINKIIDERLTVNTIKQKYPEENLQHLEGIVHNFIHKCYLCNNILGKNYNLLMCDKCRLNLGEIKNYPIICSECSRVKLSRGCTKFTWCDICKSSCIQLGITIFS